jgi:TRAP-type mannitol/chloroaromatic compound transport system permease small subunit
LPLGARVRPERKAIPFTRCCPRAIGVDGIGGVLVTLISLLCREIDRLNELVGRLFCWLVLVLVAVQFAVVIMRYVFGVGSIFLQEGIVYVHAIMFLVVAGYTLLHDEHVRVDIFYRGLDQRGKAIVNIAGVLLFLFPSLGLILWQSLPYVIRSWQTLEGSSLIGGVPAVFLLKTFIPIFAILVLLQGISLLLHSLSLLLAGRATSPNRRPMWR